MLRLSGRKWIVILVVAVACGGPPADRAALADWFRIDTTPRRLESPVSDPYGQACSRIGLNFDELDLPRAWQSGYRAVGRHPLVEAVAADPGVMIATGRGLVGEIRRAQARGLGPLCRVANGTLGIRSSWPTNAVARGDINLVRAALRSTMLDDDLQKAVVDLFAAYVVCSGVNEMLVTSGAVGRASKILDDNPAVYLFPEGKPFRDPTFDTTASVRFLDRLRSLDLSVYEKMAATLADRIDEVARLRDRAGRAGFRTVRVRTTVGLVVLAGGGDDVHEAAPFVVDFGGDDRYPQGAASSRLSKKNVSVCVDLGGNDSYGNEKLRASLGFGQLGVGILADLAGDDVYAGGNLTQGAGMFGCGILLDSSGNDRYEGAWLCQGFGGFGVGLLADGGGDDRYASVSASQGSGTTLGCGVLTDAGGDDTYVLKSSGDPGKPVVNVGFGMGCGFAIRNMKFRGGHTAWGGVGVLNDSSGDDRYTSPGISVMGGGYVLGFGLLADGGGDDRYEAGTGLGSALHVSSALFIDEGGDDTYHGTFRTGGAGADLSVGVFLELGGNDTYNPGQSCFGASCKRGGVSLFVEESGDDVYRPDGFGDRVATNSWGSYGTVWPDKGHDSWPHAVHLDLGGEDRYPTGLANQSERLHFGHGIHLDCEGGRGVPKGRPFELPDETTSPGTSWRAHMTSGNLLHRFLGAGLILSRDLEGQSELIRELESSTESDFNRDALEALSYGLTRGVWTDDLKEAYAGLLFASPDREVRARVAMDIGYFGLEKQSRRLVGYLKETDDVVGTRMALSTLRRTGVSEHAVLGARYLSHGDAGVRRNAVRLVALDPSHRKTLRSRFGEETDPSVRVELTTAFGRMEGDGREDQLKNWLSDDDVYLRRAAGRQLALMGRIEGLDALVESLSFGSIDSTFNYGDNLYREISRLTGHRFRGAAQVDPDTWKSWYAAHRDSIDISSNLKTARNKTPGR